MKKSVAFIVLICCAVSVLSVRKSKPAATVFPAEAFSGSPTTTKPTTATATTKPTTATATTKPTTATATTKPTTATTNATTATTNATTATTKPTTAATNATTATTKPTTATTKPTTAATNATTAATNATTAATNATTATTNATTTTATSTTTTSTTQTTTPTPTPPAPAVGTYNITTKDNKTCLMAQMGLQLQLEKAKKVFTVNPNNTKVQGECNTTKANFTLTFKEGFITFIFNKSLGDDLVYVSQLSFDISLDFDGTNQRYSADNTSVRLFAAKVGRSYSCKNESLFMGKDMCLDVTQDRMQAFNLTNDKDFGSPEPCAADKPDYSVAIGVGVALLVLIVIVIIVYIVSRKKRTEGYQSL